MFPSFENVSRLREKTSFTQKLVFSNLCGTIFAGSWDVFIFLWNPSSPHSMCAAKNLNKFSSRWHRGVQSARQNSNTGHSYSGESPELKRPNPPPPQRIARCMLMLVRENLGQDLLAVRGVCTPGSALSLDKFKLRDHAPEIKHA